MENMNNISSLPAEFLNWTTLFKSSLPSTYSMFSASNMQIVTCSLYTAVFVIPVTKVWLTFLILLLASEAQLRDKKLGYQLRYLIQKPQSEILSSKNVLEWSALPLQPKQYQADNNIYVIWQSYITVRNEYMYFIACPYRLQV